MSGINKRDKTLDIVRFIAMSGVLFDHYLCRFGNDVLTKFCLYLGGVSVCLFLCLTAYIYGLKWKNDSYRHFDFGSFFKSRFVRIVVPLWIVILFAFVFDYITSQQVDFLAYLYNIFGLGWFRQVNSGGHLWYITILYILYAAILLFSFHRPDKISVRLIVFMLIVMSVLYVWHPAFLLPVCKSSVPLVLIYAVLLFYKSDEIMLFFGNHLKLSVLLLLVLLASMVATVFCLPNDISFANNSALLMLGYNFGFLLFCTIIPLLKKFSSKDIRLFAVKESYEIYLVHPFVATAVSMFCSNVYLFLPVWLVLTYLIAVLIRKVCNIITKK